MFCKCGCGKITPIAYRNRYELGHIKGKHIDYLKGHKARGKKGCPRTQIWKDRISKTRRERGVAKRELNPNWKGGINKLQSLIRNSDNYKKWRYQVFQKDDFSCIKCKKIGNGKNLNADHINPLSIIIRKNKIINFEDALTCDEMWDTNNGRTLCIECHKNTSSYGWKIWNSYLRKLNKESI